jgi:hypothetical protein
MFFCLLLFEGTFTSFFKDKKSKKSHKHWESRVFLPFLLADRRIRIRIHTLTNGSGFGFLYRCLFHCPVCRNINIKGKYGFIELDEAEDAEDAVKELDGKSFNGGRCGYPGYPVPRVSDPNRIRIQSGQWIRIQNPVPNA